MRGLTSEEYDALRSSVPGAPDRTLDDSEVGAYHTLLERGLLREEVSEYIETVQDPDGSWWKEVWTKHDYFTTAPGLMMMRLYETGCALGDSVSRNLHGYRNAGVE